MQQFTVSTSRHDQFVDITRQVQACVSEAGLQTGSVIVFIPHTTCAVTINENADPDVQRDFIYAINKAIPWDDGYHHCEGNAAAHLKASLTGFSQTVLVEGGQLVLGTWQGLELVEYDGPRTRKVLVQMHAA